MALSSNKKYSASTALSWHRVAKQLLLGSQNPRSPRTTDEFMCGDKHCIFVYVLLVITTTQEEIKIAILDTSEQFTDDGIYYSAPISQTEHKQVLNEVFTL